MRALLCLAFLILGPVCFADIPALKLGRPLPNGCLIHAMLYIAGLDPTIGTGEMVAVLGGGGVPHVIAVISTADGRRYGRDEDLGVFVIGDEDPQAAFDQARREAVAARRFRGGATIGGRAEVRRSLRAAYERLQSAGFSPAQMNDLVIWRTGANVYVYSPARGCAQIRTCSQNLARIATAAMHHWTRR